jgi:hypothetical protein
MGYAMTAAGEYRYYNSRGRTMDADEYKSTLNQLGLTQAAFGVWLGVHEVTSKKWAADGPPVLAAKWLRYMKAKKLTPEQVDHAIRLSLREAA